MTDAPTRRTARPPGATPLWFWPMAAFSGAAAWAPPASRVGEVCFNTSDDRLSGDPDRSLLCRADHHLHLSAYRQCRRQSPRTSRPRRRRRAASCCAPTSPSRRTGARAQPLDAWLKSHGLIGIAGVDTRAPDPAHPRRRRAQRRARLCARRASSTSTALLTQARAWPGLEGMDLAKEVTCRQSYDWDETGWSSGQGYGRLDAAALPRRRGRLRRQAQHPAHAGGARLPRHRGAGDGERRGHPAPQARRRSSCRTARATRRRPANMPCR